MAQRTLRCNIEDIAKWHPWFYLEPHIVSCAAVLARYGPAPALFDVECTRVKSTWLGDARRFRLEIGWSNETERKADRLRATVQPKPLVEMAATAVALVLSHRVLALGQLDVTRYGERTDFRSVAVDCMLEISGTEMPDHLGRRQREKIAQAMTNPLGWDSYVVVCAFFQRGHRVRLSFHSPEGSTHG
ncbi:MAG TPA: hypothetical protein VLI90_04770 [Tepidisphaeraceae bacterium]|nr:hypothetical protein [Tepidisphaeraceae bacterium]